MTKVNNILNISQVVDMRKETVIIACTNGTGKKKKQTFQGKVVDQREYSNN